MPPAGNYAVTASSGDTVTDWVAQGSARVDERGYLSMSVGPNGFRDPPQVRVEF